MITPHDEIFLRRALRLAMNGRGHVEPNPMVGCVLAKNGQTIGEGWHEKFGGPHAEPNALDDCKARGNDPAGATAYVTLEPCCHTDKKTPPCVPRLIEAKVARVVIGCRDPNPAVNGNGVATLRAAGVKVDILSGPLSPVPGGKGWGEWVVAPEGQDPRRPRATTPSPPPSRPGTGERGLDGSHFQQLIAPFSIGQQWSRDYYLTLKWAESADGRVAGRNGARMQITNARSSHLVHQLRARHSAIVVGVNTVINDDPELTVRGVAIEREREPSRIVLDRQLRIPPHAKLIETDRQNVGGVLLVACSAATYRESPRVAELKALRICVKGMYADGSGEVDLEHGLGMILDCRDEVRRDRDVLAEPGPTLARAMLPWADRLWIFRSPTKINAGPSAPRAAVIPDHYVPTGTLTLAGDTLTEYLNTNSPAFFAAVPSADFVLAQEAAASSVT